MKKPCLFPVFPLLAGLLFSGSAAASFFEVRVNTPDFATFFIYETVGAEAPAVGDYLRLPDGREYVVIQRTWQIWDLDFEAKTDPEKAVNAFIQARVVVEPVDAIPEPGEAGCPDDR